MGRVVTCSNRLLNRQQETEDRQLKRRFYRSRIMKPYRWDIGSRPANELRAWKADATRKSVLAVFLEDFPGM